MAGVIVSLGYPLVVIVICVIQVLSLVTNGKGGAIAQSMERATPGEEVPSSIPAVAACSPLVGSVSV